MALKDELKHQTNMSKSGRGVACTVTLCLDKLKPARRKEYLEAFRDPAIFTSVICNKLAEETKIALRASTASRHRRNACACIETRPEYKV